jgi:hypothetical protein
VTRISDTLRERLHFLLTCRSILLRMRNVSDKTFRKNQNTHFMFNKVFFRKSCISWENVEKNIVVTNRSFNRCSLEVRNCYNNTSRYTIKLAMILYGISLELQRMLTKDILSQHMLMCGYYFSCTTMLIIQNIRQNWNPPIANACNTYSPFYCYHTRHMACKPNPYKARGFSMCHQV